MPRSLRILLADDDQTVVDAYSAMLRSLGHDVLPAAKDGHELVQFAAHHRPDLIISDIVMGDLDGIDAVRRITAEEPVPVIFVSGYCDPELIERAQSDHVLAYLIKPVRKADLETAIGIAVGRFAEYQILRMEAEHYRQTLASRKIIERAKGILMQKTGLSESDAFARLQSLAREQQRKVVEIAEMVLDGNKLLE